MNVLSNIDPTTLLGKIQLAAIATNDVSDEAFEAHFLNYEVKDLDDVLKIIDVIQINRPELYKKYQGKILQWLN